jgi:hypothetical protein
MGTAPPPRERAGLSFVFTSNVDGQFQRAGFRGEAIVREPDTWPGHVGLPMGALEALTRIEETLSS